jgi:hypothetical protein
MSDYFRLGHVRPGFFRLGQNRLGQLMPRSFRLGHVTSSISGYYRLCKVRPYRQS